MTTETASARAPRKIHSAFVELTLARIREFLREPGALFWTFGFPILITIALGVAFRDQAPPQVNVAVIEGPSAAKDAEVIARTGRLAPKVMGSDEAAEALRKGRVALVVAPQPDGAVSYRFDPVRPESLPARMLADEALQRAAGRADVRATSDDKVTAPGARYVDWLIPGLLGMQLMSGSVWGVAWAIVQTRQRKLLKRLMATPMRKRDYLLAFLVSRFFALALEVPILMGFGYFAFGVVIRGSIVALAAVCLLGSSSFAGLGMLCASRAENSETANGLINLATLPMFVVSGVFFSAQRFPELVQPVIRLLPLTALNEALRGVVNEGASITSMPFQLAVMAAWAVLSFALALRIFRWN